jgi:hypothetical protein
LVKEDAAQRGKKPTSHVIVYGMPTGTISPNPGFVIAFPDGLPTGVVYAATSEAVDARIAAVNEKSILGRLADIQMAMHYGVTGTAK